MSRPSCLALLALLLLSTSSVEAQQGPIGQASTGTAPPGTSAVGDAERIPLVLPPERHGLALPLVLGFAGGSQVREAGVGWGLSYSYVTRNDSLSRQRPRYGTSGVSLDDLREPLVQDRAVVVVLGGQRMRFVPIDPGPDPVEFRAAVDHQTMRLLRTAAGWDLFTGDGKRHRFASLPALANDSIWYLTEVASGHHAQSRVELTYRVATRTADTLSAKELYLDALRYNFDPSGTCAKHEVRLTYGGAEIVPGTTEARWQAIFVDNGRLRVRTERIEQVQVLAQGATCGTAQALSTYRFSYAPDADTRRSRLVTVDVFGRAGTPEQTRAAPVTRLVYGSASATMFPSTGQVFMTPRAPLPLPAGHDDLGRLVSNGAVQPRHVTSATIVDVDGDGLVDLVDDLSWWRNRGAGTSLTPMGQLFPNGDGPDAIAETMTGFIVRRYPYYSAAPSASTAHQDTIIQIVDFNGDGRADVLQTVADDVSDWRVHLNEPAGWRTIDIDLGNVREQLAPFGIGDSDELPLSRSITTADTRVYRCSTSATEFLGCAGELPLVDVLSAQRTRVLWKLVDVNGDGYLDLVANSRPSQLLASGEQCSAIYEDINGQPALGNDWINACWIEYTLTFVDFIRNGNVPPEPVTDNHLVVFYNRGGVRFGAAEHFLSATDLADSATSCGVEEWQATALEISASAQHSDDGYDVYGAIWETGSVQHCGLLDLNGDGLVDRVTAKRVALGTGLGFAGDFDDIYGNAVAVTASNYFQACRIGDPPDDATFTTTTAAGYVDLTGDGVVDWVSDRTVLIGSALGLAPPVAIEAPAPIVLSETRAPCDGGWARTTKLLADLSGDGRPELLTLDEERAQLDVLEIWHPGHGAGAPAAGRIVETHNGNGAAVRTTYRNLKSDQATVHAVPFPEVMPVETRIVATGGVGADQEPGRTAYGGAHLFYDAEADRWTFRGYQRVVSVRGLPAPLIGGLLYGSATLRDVWLASELAPGFDRYASTGRPRRSVRLAGYVPSDPASLLTIDGESDPRWHSHEDHEPATRRTQLSGYSSDSDDCTAVGQPYGSSIYFLGGGDLDPGCRTIGFGYTQTVTARRGTFAGASDDQVATRTITEQVDELGRPLRVLRLGDLARADDDRCEVTSYAITDPAWPDWHVTNAAAVVQTVEPLGGELSVPTCVGAGKVIAGGRMRYDGLAEGRVAVGSVTHEIVERRDVASGALLDSWVGAAYELDEMRQLSRILEESGQGLTRTITLEEYDGFHLHPRSRTLAADDVAHTQTWVEDVDPVSLVPVSAIDPRGVVHRRSFDGYGRLVRTTVTDPRDGIELAVADVSYLDDTSVLNQSPADASHPPASDVIHPQGRRVRSRAWHTAVPAASIDPGASAPAANERWTTHWLDHLGRRRHAESTLGGDYSGGNLISDQVTYDTLGQPSFAADLYLAGSAGVRYGTSLLRRPDGSVQCSVRGRGPQTAATTSNADARFASCNELLFDGYQAILRLRGPVENDATHSAYGAYEELRSDALGRRRSQWRRQGTTTFERMDLGYDRLGRETSITRHTSPSGGGTQIVWTTVYDSLGWARSFAEPGAATRTATYDRAGNLLTLSWPDGSLARNLTSSYDGFGRIERTRDRNCFGGMMCVNILGSDVDYAYDEGSGESFHADTTYALGRMTRASSSAQSIYFGYDPLGRNTFTAWRNAQGLRVERRADFRLDGAPAWFRFGLPDNNYAAETATYTYDSAQRPKRVRWTDEVYPGGIDLYNAQLIDALGRPREVRFGNAALLARGFRDADRNELTSRQLTSGGALLSAGFKYDAALRETERTETSSVGAGQVERMLFSYDAAGRLAQARVQNLFNASQVYAQERFTYDGLGNLSALIDDVGTLDFTAYPQTGDPDRLCRVAGAGFPTGTACNFTYDVLGNVLVSPLTASTSRRLTYDHRGRTTRIERLVGTTPSGASATYAYGPFGGVASLTLTASATGDTRTDVRFGEAGELSQGRYDRFIPGPEGTLAIKRGVGATAKFLYPMAERAGARVTTDQTGAVVQETRYRPFGGLRVNTAPVGDLNYNGYLFNGGDQLPDFAAVQLGARMYEPRLGRFLQRDPLVRPRSSGKAHPYAFAWNDPINRSDPTGMEPPEETPPDTSGGGLGGFAVGVALAWGVDYLSGNGSAEPAPEAPALDGGKVVEPSVEDELWMLERRGLYLSNVVDGSGRTRLNLFDAPPFIDIPLSKLGWLLKMVQMPSDQAGRGRRIPEQFILGVPPPPSDGFENGIPRFRGQVGPGGSKARSIDVARAEHGYAADGNILYRYRGVSANHPQIVAARNGSAIPGNIHGAATAEAHNLGGVAADSAYTSWTDNLKVALFHANKDGPGGVVLRVPVGAPPEGASWSWEFSPDEYGEGEIFLRGERHGADVFDP